MKEALLHLLFLAVVVFAASFLKKDKPRTIDVVEAPALAYERDTTALHLRR